VKKPKRLVVGLTGGIGTGKSTALKAFERLGAATVCLDQLAKEQAKPGRDGYKAIVKNFGTRVLKSNGDIDRALLGREIFGDPRAKARLERATHPLILKEMRRLIGKMTGLVVVDTPLLFEKNLQKNFDATMVISCRPSLQLKRIVARDGLTPREARRRINAQWPLARKRALADVALDNDQQPEQLHKNIQMYHEGLALLLGGLSHGNAD